MQTTALGEIINHRYQLQRKIGEGGMGIVYQALDRVTGQTIAIKRVLVEPDELEFTSKNTSIDFRVALSHEFQMLASLRHPQIISVRDYGFDGHQRPYVVMEFLKDATPITEFVLGKPIEDKVRYLAQLLQTLAYLHRRGVVHRDLKPDNVLVSGEQVKVLDFGLSVVKDYQSQAENTEEIIGTLTYLAPEILRGTAPHTSRSDLFAVGVIAYEMFAEKYPFNKTSIVDLIDDIVYQEPNFEALKVPLPLENVIRQLFSKERLDRQQSANEVLQALETATGIRDLVETLDTRESYLQSAQFVGREKELRQLRSALINLLKGTGDAILIGGESGIGKSRLLDEIDTLARIQGTLVLRGQAIAESGAPYFVWREVVRNLVIFSDVADEDIPILGRVLPDIGNLLQRDAPAGGDLDAEAFQSRLLEIVEGLFRQQDMPIVLLFEDLQWANESLTILRVITRLAHERPILICATYRDDERPDLSTELPRMKVIPLQRMKPSEIEKLSVSILGERGRDRNLIKLLERETEGNVFFIVEVMRELAKEAGRLAQIPVENLPETVVAGGMQAMLQRRIDRVAPDARPLLEIAAVIGREIDLNLLGAIAPDQSLDDWLLEVDTILDVNDNRWRFSHDKLRDKILVGLEPEYKRDLHRRIATTIEAIYPDNSDYYGILAYHWMQVRQPEKEWHYSNLAGQLAYETSAYRETIQLLEHALTVQPENADPLHIGRIYRYIGESYIGIGQTLVGCRQIEKASAVLGYPLLEYDSSSGKMSRDLLKQLFVQALIRFGVHRPKAKPEELPRLQAALELDEQITRGYRVSNTDPRLLFSANLRLANRAEKSPEVSHLAQATVLLGIIFSSTPLLGVAKYYINRATQFLDMIEDDYGRMVVWRSRGFYFCGLGQCEQGIADSKVAHQMALEQQKWREAQELALIIAAAANPIGDLETVRKYLTEVEQLARRLGDNVIIGYACVGNLILLAWSGKLDEYEALVKFTEPYINPADPQVRFQYEVHCGILAYHQGDYPRAIAYIEKTLDTCDILMSYLFMQIGSIACLARIAFLMVDEFPDDERCQILRKRAYDRVKNFNSLYRIADAMGLLYQALMHSNNPKRARKLLEKSLALAQEKGFLYDQARAHAELSRLTTGEERTNHVEQATDLFDQLQLAWEVDYIIAQVTD